MQTGREQRKLAGVSRVLPYVLLAISLATVLVFILLAQYSHPSSDDLCMATGVDDHGLIGQLWEHYFEWSGRYTSNALYAVYPAVFGLLDGYRLFPVFMLLALFLATAFFLSAFFRVRMFSPSVSLVSLCFVSIFLLGMLSPASGLYWMAGAMTYQFANILLLVVLALMFKLSDRQRSSKQYSGLMLCLLLLIMVAVGTNETSMLALTGIALLGVFLHLRSGWQTLKPWLLILVTTLVCFSVVYLSPGNLVRAADFPLRHDLLRSIDGSLSVGLKVMSHWLSNPVLVISSLLVPFSVARLFQLSRRGQLTGRQFSYRQLTGSSLVVSKTVIAVLLVSTFVMPFLLQFPAWWSMGGWPPARTQDAIYFLFIVSWYLTIGAVTVRQLLNGRWQWILTSYNPATAITLLILSVLYTAAVLQSNSYQRAKNDLAYLARPYHEYMNTRYQQIEQAVINGQRFLAVADYQQAYPRSIYFNDITYNQDDWRNDCYADYFGLEKIKRERAE